MDGIRCGEPDCDEMARYQGVVEIANLTGGMMGGLFDRSRGYKCPSGHVTTRRTALARVKALFKGTRVEGGDHTNAGSPAKKE